MHTLIHGVTMYTLLYDIFCLIYCANYFYVDCCVDLVRYWRTCAVSVMCWESCTYLVNEVVDGLIAILTCENDYTVMTVLTDGYKTYHITSEAWTIRGLQNPNYTVPVCLCVVKIQPLQVNVCSGLYVMMSSKVPVSLNNSFRLSGASNIGSHINS